MTDRATKLRALYLSGIVVFAMVAPLLAFSGSALAAGNVAADNLNIDSDDWHQFQNGTQNTGHNPAVSGPVSGVNKKWNFSTGGRVETGSTIVNNTVYTLPKFADNDVYALNATDGSERWNYSTSSTISGSPAVGYKTVYLGDGSGTLYALNTTDGSERWTFATENSSVNTPTLDNNTVYFGTSDIDDGLLYAVNATDGSERWKFRLDSGDVLGAPAVDNDTVYISGQSNNTLFALNTTDGSERWNYSADNFFSAGPAVVNNTVYVGNSDNNVYALNATDGSERWNYSSGDIVDTSPAVVNNTIYFGNSAGDVYALNTTDGSKRWNFSTDGFVSSSPVVTSSTVYFGSSDNDVYALNATNGSQRWNFTTGRTVQASPAVKNRVLYVGSSDGDVYALEEPPVTVSGTVTDDEGNLISGAQVFVGSKSAVTDSNGDYSVQVSPGSYEVVVVNPPDFEVKPVTVQAGTPKTVDFEFQSLPGTGTITGKVVDSSGEGVPSVTVNARDLGYKFFSSATTDVNGEFTLTNVRAANYTVRVDTSSNPSVDSPPKTVDRVTVNEGETNDVGEITLAEPGYISGKVENASGPVEGVSVVADSRDSIFVSRTQADGTYNITAVPGDYTVSVFTKDQNAPSQDVTVTGGSTTSTDFTLEKTEILDSSVEVISNSGGVDTSNIGISAAVQRGMLQAKLTNQSGGPPGGGVGGAPDELEGLGVSDSTEFRMNMTVTNFTASSLMWGVNNASWSTSQNDTNPDATDITVTGTPVQIQVNFTKSAQSGVAAVGPLMTQDPAEVDWPTGQDDRATDGRNKTIYFGIFDLSNLPGTVQNNMNGMSVTTNAQRFSTPSVVNNSLRVWVAAPTKTVAGNDHGGFYQAEIPQAQLDEWGVSDPESELNALYKGTSTDFTVTDTDDGARVRLENISYSAGFAEVEATTSPSSGDDGPSTDPGSDDAGQGGGAGPATEVTTQQTDTGTEATIEQVTLEDPSVSISTEGATSDGVSVTEVSATFEKATNSESTMSISASSSPPSGTPAPPSTDTVLSYVDVTVEGSLANSISEGRFTVDVSEAGVDPAGVTAQRYDGNEWEDVETEPVDESTVEIISPEGYSAFAIGASETAEPEQPTATQTAVETDTPVETPSTAATPSGTATPAQTATPTPTGGGTATPEQTATTTPGTFGPGFGVVAALLAIVAALGARRLRRP